MNFFGDMRPRGAGRESLECDTVSTIAREQLEQFVRWIDPLRDPNEVTASLQEFKRREQALPHSPWPLEARCGSERVAGAYMMLLGARVAALAGVRAVDNHAPSAVKLLNQLVTDVRSHGVVQIQAILDGTDSVATEIVQLAGFVPLAELQQLVLMLEPISLPPISCESVARQAVAMPPTDLHSSAAEQTDAQVGGVRSRGLESELRETDGQPSAGGGLPLTIILPEPLNWLPASDVPRDKWVQLLAHTFIETLDCPSLNGLRSPDDVLEGFLDGQALNAQEGWWALSHQEQLIGCVLVSALPSGASELIYMGLAPTSRGRGYGKLLLEQAIVAARRFGGSMFMAAVDCANWPAMRLYLQSGFREHARVQAWFYRP